MPDMPFLAYQFPEYTVVTDQPIDDGFLLSVEVLDEQVVEILDNLAAFEFVEGKFVIYGETP